MLRVTAGAGDHDEVDDRGEVLVVGSSEDTPASLDKLTGVGTAREHVGRSCLRDVDAFIEASHGYERSELLVGEPGEDACTFRPALLGCVRVARNLQVSAEQSHDGVDLSWRLRFALRMSSFGAVDELPRLGPPGGELLCEGRDFGTAMS